MSLTNLARANDFDCHLELNKAVLYQRDLEDELIRTSSIALRAVRTLEKYQVKCEESKKDLAARVRSQVATQGDAAAREAWWDGTLVGALVGVSVALGGVLIVWATTR